MSQRPGLARSIPFGLFIGIMVLDPLLEPLLPGGLDGRWLYGVRVGLVLAALLVLWRHYTELTDPAPVGRTDWVMGLVVGGGIFLLWVNLDIKPLALAGGEGFDPRVGGDMNLALAAVRLAGATLIVPVMEELFWRSFIFRWLQHPRFLSVRPASVGVRAWVVHSALFASEHRLWFAGLLAGLAYGWLYKRTGNLWIPILAHALTNGLLGVYVLSTGSWSLW